jgi:hypothetical protein
MDEFEYQNVIKHLGNYIDDLKDEICKLKGEIFDMKLKANGLDEEDDPFANLFRSDEIPDTHWTLVKNTKPKKRGRPVGVKNKPKAKKRGRPVGSKNKAKK